MSQPQQIQSQITFLYYDDMAPIAVFLEQVMGFELVEDQKWAKIYRIGGISFLGAVASDKGFHRPQEENAVLITLVVEDVAGWYEHLSNHGVKLLSDLQYRKEIQIRCFFFQDPGGYSFEVQQFLKPGLAEIFHPTAL
jgi:hypothetical protein